MKLLLKEIKDRYIQENFKRIQKELADLGVADTDTYINNIIANIENVEYAAKLIIDRTASEDIAQWAPVRLDSPTTAANATPDVDYDNAKVIGLAQEAALTGATVRILLFGVAEDSSFSYTLNEPLFLNTGNVFGLTAPSASGEFITNVGQSLGAGAVFVNVKDPVEIL